MATGLSYLTCMVPAMPSFSARRRERYATDPEYRARINKQHREYRAKNRDRINAQNRANHAANPERQRAVNRAWREANAEKVAEQQRRRDARRDRAKDRVTRLYSKHGITPEEWAALWKTQEGRCFLCAAELAAEPCRNAVLDHDHKCCGPQRSCSICRRGIACQACNMIIGWARDDPPKLLHIAENLVVANEAVSARIAAAPVQDRLFD